MMDHTALLAQLSPETRATLTDRSDTEGLRHLTLTTGTILITGSWIAFALPLWHVAILLHGIGLVFLFTLEHECTHQTPFKTPWLNELIGRICAMLLFLPFLWFRYFHLAHHRHTNDPDRDPELAGPGRPETWHAYLIYLSGWHYWRSVFRTLAHNALGRIDAEYLPPSRHTAMAWEARLMLALYVVALITAPRTLFWLWLLPLLVGMPVLRLYLLAEHGHCPPVANMLANSRTTFTSRMVRFLAWNMPYHAEHHAYPAVPFHKLPEFHTSTQAHLQATAPGYVAFHADYQKQLS